MLGKIAFYQNRRDEVPNQQLAKELAETENKIGIKEIAENLQHKNKSVQTMIPLLKEQAFRDFSSLPRSALTASRRICKSWIDPLLANLPPKNC